MTNKENSKEIRTVVIIGAGNLAWHLGHHLLNAGIRILQVFNRTPEKGQELADELHVPFTSLIADLVTHADLYILAVSDDSIEQVIKTGLFNSKQLVVHTAGSIGIDVFSGRVENYGVFYPLQTLTRGKPVDFSPVPLLVEANNEVNLKKIKALASRLSRNIYEVDSDERMYLHLAAVIASNFTNHILAVSETILKERDLSFDLLKPLIRETVEKALTIPPGMAQTGPAVRGNTRVIEKHLSLLEHLPGIRELYRIITESIISMNSNE